MSVKDGLLVLLARGPSYGYQLKADFEDATGGAWTLNIGQVYTSLQRLERDGLVQPVAGGDDERRSYALTAAGREAVDHWLAQPVARSLEERDEVAMKVLLAATAPGRDPRRVIRAQRESTMAVLQEHTRAKAAAARPTLATLVHLDRLILACRAELDWLDLCEARLDEPGLVAGLKAGDPADPTTAPGVPAGPDPGAGTPSDRTPMTSEERTR